MSRLLRILVIATVLAAALPGPTRADSLWPADRKASLYEDQRPRAVGDLLTVVVVQTSTATHSAESATKKSESASTGTASGLLDFFPDFGYDASRATSGSGSTVSKTQLTDRVTVKVIELLPNGVLKIEGVRATAINAEKLEVRLTGVVRSQDVGADNTVLSSQVADQQLVFTGKGPIAEKQRPGLISRLLHFLF